MGKRLSYTPRSRIRAALRQLWLRSRERAAAIKRDKYTCQRCHRKQTMVKGKEFRVQVHHMEGISNWESVIDSIYQNILCNPDYLQTLCDECHQAREAEK
jgi:5-methylcytosine-specific restriction endonuclease McrA